MNIPSILKEAFRSLCLQMRRNPLTIGLAIFGFAIAAALRNVGVVAHGGMAGIAFLFVLPILGWIGGHYFMIFCQLEVIKRHMPDRRK